MLTLQRSPWVLCADVVQQINLDEYPALADLGAGYLSGPGFFLQGHRVNLEQGGGFLQGKRAHGVSSMSRPSLPGVRSIPTHGRLLQPPA